MQFIPILWPDYDVADAQGLKLAMQAVAERPGFVTTVNGFGLFQLLFGPNQKIFGRELLRRLRRGVIQLPDHPIAIGVNVDAQLDALGFRRALCCFSHGVGIGIGIHTTLV